jgi:hypothetical protein
MRRLLHLSTPQLRLRVCWVLRGERCSVPNSFILPNVDDLRARWRYFLCNRSPSFISWHYMKLTCVRLCGCTRQTGQSLIWTLDKSMGMWSGLKPWRVCVEQSAQSPLMCSTTTKPETRRKSPPTWQPYKVEHQADRKRRLLGQGACSVLRVVMFEVKKSRNESNSPQSKYQDM